MKHLLIALTVLASAPAFARIVIAPGRIVIGPGPIHRVGVVCQARNARGEIFRATGGRPAFVQERAMSECRTRSNVCVALGCR